MSVQSFSQPSPKYVLFAVNEGMDIQSDNVTEGLGGWFLPGAPDGQRLYMTTFDFFWQFIMRAIPYTVDHDAGYIIISDQADSLGRREAIHHSLRDPMQIVSLGLLTSISGEEASRMMDDREPHILNQKGVWFGFLPLDAPKSIGEAKERQAEMEYERSQREIGELKDQLRAMIEDRDQLSIAAEALREHVRALQAEVRAAQEAQRLAYNCLDVSNDDNAELRDEVFRLKQQLVAKQITIDALQRQVQPAIDNRRRRFGLIDTMEAV